MRPRTILNDYHEEVAKGGVCYLVQDKRDPSKGVERAVTLCPLQNDRNDGVLVLLNTGKQAHFSHFEIISECEC